ncbi:hypothetical protein Riv7116_4741 [Rivularia sp. PCC 7116]|uniref:hypothetical protein n=1 Tax=Rivularia sp. PCC 7116 TaxID=373994 RepID=UPI00029F1C9E|nr:hypothetical protein [Rivularia sp. PCC 7116]AFY57155.1 hypothetical protein Riv7116_4741 [Rivularia sp. PCC 7116]
MNVIICPGIHESSLTQNFIKCLLETDSNRLSNNKSVNILEFPANNLSVLSGFHIWQFLRESLADKLKSPVVFIGFSAGVVGAISAASLWQIFGGNVKAFIAIDGWMVPIHGNFPIHRMSHDYFTHWSSCLLGSSHNNFYAQPAVEHLELWRSPSTVEGYSVDSPSGELPLSLTGAEFIQIVLKSYEEI